MSDDFPVEEQKLLLSFMVAEPDLWIRSNSVVKSSFFHKSLRPVVEMFKTHSSKYNNLPTLEQVSSKTKTELHELKEIRDSDREWFLDNVETFCKRRALEEWLTNGMDYIEEGRYGALEQGLKDALLMSLTNDIGTYYYKNPKERLERMKANNGQVSTGWKTLDDILYGGFNRGELNIFAAVSGGGKSLFLQNISLNMSMMFNLNVIYVSLELSEELIGMRLDSMVSGITSKDIYKNIDEVNLRVREAGRNAGNIIIKNIKQGSKVNDIKSLIKEVELETGKRPDVIVVDYLDLLHPNDLRISPDNMFLKDKYVSEELRGMANEMYGQDHRLLLITASQLNRSAVDEGEFNHANIAGGISKINTADNLIGIFTSQAMMNKGRYQLQLMKTRNSAGVGNKFDLAFDRDSLRITDISEEDQDDSATYSSASSVLSQISQKNSANGSTSASPKTGEKPKDLLSIIKNNN